MEICIPLCEIADSCLRHFRAFLGRACLCSILFGMLPCFVSLFCSTILCLLARTRESLLICCKFFDGNMHVCSHVSLTRLLYIYMYIEAVIYEPRHEKTVLCPMGPQRRRSEKTGFLVMWLKWFPLSWESSFVKFACDKCLALWNTMPLYCNAMDSSELYRNNDHPFKFCRIWQSCDITQWNLFDIKCLS